MKIRDILLKGIQNLKDKQTEDSAISARVLLCYVLKMTKQEIVINSEQNVEKEKEELYHNLINKMIEGKPLQYITNHQEFMKLNFYVDESVLIPQPDTEVLVEKVIEYNNSINKKSVKVLDLCTGSGAIAISLAKYIPNSEIWASDISNKALQVAKLNAEKNLVHKKIKFIESDMFKNINEKFDIIVSNPPYIRTEVINKLSQAVQNEPILALNGGSDGLDFYKIIAKKAPKCLNDDGIVFLEIGYDQKESVIEILNNIGEFSNIYCIKDFSNNDRVIIAEKY